MPVLGASTSGPPGEAASEVASAGALPLTCQFRPSSRETYKASFWLAAGGELLQTRYSVLAVGARSQGPRPECPVRQRGPAADATGTRCHAPPDTRPAESRPPATSSPWSR